MTEPRDRAPLAESAKPASPKLRVARSRLSLKHELVLATMPTATVLAMLALVEVLTEQRLLFASLASSAFLIYLDPEHGANRVRALVASQLLAALLGWGAYAVIGPGYAAAGIALVGTIVLMIVLDALHPPAVATAMSFALRAGDVSNLVLFGLALSVTASLVVLQRVAVWGVVRLRGPHRHSDEG